MDRDSINGKKETQVTNELLQGGFAHGGSEWSINGVGRRLPVPVHLLLVTVPKAEHLVKGLWRHAVSVVHEHQACLAVELLHVNAESARREGVWREGREGHSLHADIIRTDDNACSRLQAAEIAAIDAGGALRVCGSTRQGRVPRH